MLAVAFRAEVPPPRVLTLAPPPEQEPASESPAAQGTEATQPEGAAEAPETAETAPAASRPSFIGNVVIFNDEIVEPVSFPITTCGGVVSLLGQRQSCDGASRVSDDDA